MKKIIFLIMLLLVSTWIVSSQNCLPCLPNGIVFETQSQVDSFQITYPGCTEITGDVHIGGNLGTGSIPVYSHIINLNGLSVLTSIGGTLSIALTDTLANLSGLDNLTSVGGDLIIGRDDGALNEPNTDLISLSNLSNLNSVGGDLWIVSNYLLPELTGLDSLKTLGGHLWILMNDALTSLNGLDNLNSINGNIWIEDNNALTSLYGIRNINANSITDLNLRLNSSLSFCAVKSICNYITSPNGIVWIYYNAIGCNSQAEVSSACGLGTDELFCKHDNIDVYPNPTSGNLNIDLGNIYNDVDIKIKNMLGQEILSEHYKTVKILNLEIIGAPGLYILELITKSEKTSVQKILKKNN